MLRTVTFTTNLLLLALVVALWVGAPFSAFFAPSPVAFVEERVEESKTSEVSVKLPTAAPHAESARYASRGRAGRGEPQPAKRPATPIRNCLRAAPLVVRLRL